MKTQDKTLFKIKVLLNYHGIIHNKGHKKLPPPFGSIKIKYVQAYSLREAIEILNPRTCDKVIINPLCKCAHILTTKTANTSNK